MILPPNVQTVGVVGTTNAVAGTVTTTAILAAPGAGIKVRTWMLQVAWRWNAAGDLEAVWIDTAVSTLFYGALSDEVRAHEVYPPGGLLSPANRGISVQTRASAVSQPFLARLLYTLEGG